MPASLQILGEVVHTVYVLKAEVKSISGRVNTIPNFDTYWFFAKI